MKPPHIVLGISANASREDADRAWRHLRSQLHPDKGGDAAAFQEAKAAYERFVPRQPKRTANKPITVKRVEVTGEVSMRDVVLNKRAEFGETGDEMWIQLGELAKRPNTQIIAKHRNSEYKLNIKIKPQAPFVILPNGDLTCEVRIDVLDFLAKREIKIPSLTEDDAWCVITVPDHTEVNSNQPIRCKGYGLSEEHSLYVVPVFVFPQTTPTTVKAAILLSKKFS
jgi:DnaJ-class molecular chaperone